MNIRIKKLDDFGRGIAFVDDKITFIANALEEELVEVKIVLNKKKYMIGEAVRIFDQNEERVSPRCPYYLKCGGCDLEHLSFSYENRFKVFKVKNILNKFARINLASIPIVSGKDYFYRNKITFVVKEGKLGLFEKESNQFVRVDKCFLLDSFLNEKLEMLQYLVQREPLITKIMLRLGNVTNEVMLSIYGEVKNKEGFLDVCDSLIINDQAVMKSYITSYIFDKKFHIRSRSFFQINNEVVEYLYAYIRDLIKELSFLRVLDLYCGVGTIGITISDLVSEVIGVEVVEEAIVDARENKELNHIQNISFICAKVEDVILKIQKNIDTVIVYPPRSGLDRKVRECLCQSSISNIIYISCDASTFARDLLELKKRYNVQSIQLFNMFPRTSHVECVCVLNRR